MTYTFKERISFFEVDRSVNYTGSRTKEMNLEVVYLNFAYIYIRFDQNLDGKFYISAKFEAVTVEQRRRLIKL